MLDIRDMFEKDKMFYFFEGLKLWARTELQRQRVQDVATTMAAVECLNDYSDDISKRKTLPSNGSSSNFGSRGKIATVDRSFSGGTDKRPPGRDTPQPKINNASNFKPRQLLACFLCKGPHQVAECPHRGALNALVASSQEGGHSQ